jgi:hypothetical protein
VHIRQLSTALMGSLTLPMAIAAGDVASVGFDHHDWELVCDNTRTCRAAGYHSEEQGDSPPVSMLLTRRAGPSAPVTAEVTLGDVDEATPARDSTNQTALRLRINGRTVPGALAQRNGHFVLNEAQVQAVLASLKRSSRIELLRGPERWVLSDRGATAVLLKMDEAQGRLNTPGALVRPGTRPEAQVLPAVPAPVVVAAPLAPAKSEDATFVERHAQALEKAVTGIPGAERCPRWEDNGADFEVSRLDAHRLLLSSWCWLAAYNSGTAYWVINDRPPFQPVFITDSATDFAKGTLSASHKGRGIGDCWGHEAWTWDGRRFTPTSAYTTGMCRLVAAGGTWVLPTLVTTVK